MTFHDPQIASGADSGRAIVEALSTPSRRSAFQAARG
jgi:hypothetical protein